MKQKDRIKNLEKIIEFYNDVFGLLMFELTVSPQYKKEEKTIWENLDKVNAYFKPEEEIGKPAQEIELPEKEGKLEES